MAQHQVTCDYGIANALGSLISPRAKADRCVATNIRMLLDLIHEDGSWQLREHPFFETVHGFGDRRVSGWGGSLCSVIHLDDKPLSRLPPCAGIRSIVS
jgi:hypothetical protein